MATKALQTSEKLTDQERLDFAEAEELFKDIQENWVTGCRILLDISERRLFREKYSTFEEYCREEWDMSRQYAYRLIGVAQVAEHFVNRSLQPDSVAQAVPLIGLPKRKALKALQNANKKAALNGKKRATKAGVQIEVEIIKSEDAPSPDPDQEGAVATDDATAERADTGYEPDIEGHQHATPAPSRDRDHRGGAGATPKTAATVDRLPLFMAEFESQIKNIEAKHQGSLDAIYPGIGAQIVVERVRAIAENL